MEQNSINFFWQLLSDFWITGALYIIIIGSFIRYTPKLIKAHFDTIKDMQKQFSENLDKIVRTFEKKMDDSNEWHLKHQKNLENTHYRIKRIEDNLKIKD